MGNGAFQFSVICLLDSEADPVIDQRPDRWRLLACSKTIQLNYNFLVHSSGHVLLDGVNLHIQGQEFPIIRMSADGRAYERLWYKLPLGEVTHRSSTGLSGTVVESNRIAGTLPPDDLFGPLIPFTNIRLVDAHRVFTDNLELRTVKSLKQDASELGPYLQWLQGDSPRKFAQIQSFITQLFPEFEFLNIESVDNRVTIRFTKKSDTSKVFLSKCGTGVEQVLALATFVIASPPGTILLIDEPHSFLHPTAERLLLEFLKANEQHRYVVTTHSAIFINAVPASQITHLTGHSYGIESRQQYSTAHLLFDLGYRNSDLLFTDRILFVEGESDQEIIPILLLKAGVPPSELAQTGICRMKGSGDVHTVTRQSEELLAVLHREGIKRVYLFDGDQKPKEGYIKKIKTVRTDDSIPLAFLNKPEIENYLLDPFAIAVAMKKN